jgi:hypothetical protein
MTKTLSKGKSNCKGSTTHNKIRFRTYFGKAKRTVLGYYAINDCGIYVADREHVGREVSCVGERQQGVVRENRSAEPKSRVMQKSTGTITKEFKRVTASRKAR